MRIHRAGPAHEQHRQPLCIGMSRHINARLVAMQRDVGDHQIDLVLLNDADCMVIILDRRGNAVAGLLQHMLIVEGDQRLIFHHQHADDGLCLLPWLRVPFD